MQDDGANHSSGDFAQGDAHMVKLNTGEIMDVESDLNTNYKISQIISFPEA